MKPMKYLLLCLCLVLIGCEPPQQTNQKTLESAPVPELEGPRFKVETQGSFRAGFENNKREILIITDTKTGTEYLCVTDASISEMKAKKKKEEAMIEAVETAVDMLNAISNE